MRFPHSFKRYVGETPEGGKRLGSDNPPESSADKSADNVFTSRLKNIDGFPLQRLVVGCKGPEGVEGGVHVRAYLLVQHSQAKDGSEREDWFLADHVELRVGSLAYLDVPMMLDKAAAGHGSTGDLEVAIVVGASTDSVRTGEGEYTFVVGGDVSNPAK